MARIESYYESSKKKNKEAIASRKTGYSDVFGISPLAVLITAIHSTKIKCGNELERYISEETSLPSFGEDKMEFEDFKDRALKCAKAHLQSKVKAPLSGRGKRKTDLDFVKIDPTRKKITITEAKAGCNFDTKKAPAEIDNLEKAVTFFQKEFGDGWTIEARFVCMLPDSQFDVKEIGDTRAPDYAIAGVEAEKLFSVKISKLQERYVKDQKENEDFFFEKVESMIKKRKLQGV